MATRSRKNRIRFLFLNKKELEFFIGNLSVLISSGMTVLDAVKAIRFEIHSRVLKKIINQVVEDLDSGLSLSRALENTGLFQEKTLFLLQIGEKSGRLSENLKIINQQQVKERELASKLTSALLYPSIVMSLTIIIGLLIALFILPRLTDVYKGLNVKLPAITQLLIDFGSFMGVYGYIAVPSILAVMILLVYFLFINKKTKISGQYLLFHFSITKSIISEIEIARMGFILGTLLKAGVPLIDSLKLLYNSSDFYVFRKLYFYLEGKIEEGYSFDKAFSGYKKLQNILPPSVTQLIVTGEQSGTLSDLLIQISKTYELKSETSTKNLAIILEPVLLIIVWLGVVFIALSVILPIYSLIGNINESANPTPAQTIQNNTAVSVTPTSTLTLTPTTTITNTPTVTQTPSPTPTAVTRLRINSAAGYLNVRNKPSSSGTVIDQVKDKEEFQYTNVQSGWYEIILEDGTTGWVSGQYITRI